MEAGEDIVETLEDDEDPGPPDSTSGPLGTSMRSLQWEVRAAGACKLLINAGALGA